MAVILIPLHFLQTLFIGTYIFHSHCVYFIPIGHAAMETSRFILCHTLLCILLAYYKVLFEVQDVGDHLWQREQMITPQMVLYRDNLQCHKINGPRGPYGVTTVLWRTVTGGNTNWQHIKKLWFKYTYLNTSWIKMLRFITYLGQDYRLLYKRKCISASAEVAWWSVLFICVAASSIHGGTHLLRSWYIECIRTGTSSLINRMSNSKLITNYHNAHSFKLQ